MTYLRTERAQLQPAPGAMPGLLGWVTRSRLVSVGVVIVLYLLLTVLYERAVAPRYSFGSFQINPRGDRWIEFAIVLLSGFALPTDPRRMSEFFTWLSAIFLLIPAAVLSAQQGSDRWALFLMFGGVGLVAALCQYLQISMTNFGIDPRRQSARVHLVILAGLMVGVLAALALHVDGQMNFSFSSVYDYREDFNKSLFFPLNYLLPFAAGPLAGLIVAGAMYQKRYGILASTVLAGVLFFAFSSHKAMLFYPIFAVGIFLALSHRSAHLYLTGIFIVLSILTFLSVRTQWEDLLGASFANRLVFVPAQIHYFFFREFAEIGPQFWAESRFSMGLTQSDLPLPSVNYIGLLMTGDPAIGANTGWIANGYMNAGVAGIVFYALILAVTMRIIDVLGERYGYSFIGAAFVIPVFSFVNSIDLLAGFLTGGLGLLFIIFFAAVRPGGNPNSRTELRR